MAPKLVVRVSQYLGGAYLRPPDLKIDWTTDQMLVGIYGRKASGKSLLSHLLAGLLEPSSGQILFQGRNYGGSSIKRRQNFYLALNEVHGFEAVKNFFFRCGCLRGLGRSAIYSKIDQIASEFKITHLLESSFHTLSHLEKKKLVLLSLLVGKAKVVLLDDFLDDIPVRCESWKRFLNQIKKQVMILFTSRSKEQVHFYSEEALQLEHHRLLPLGLEDVWLNAHSPKRSKCWLIEVRSHLRQVMELLLNDVYLSQHSIVLDKIKTNQLILTSKKNFSILPILSRMAMSKVEITGFSSYTR